MRARRKEPTFPLELFVEGNGTLENRGDALQFRDMIYRSSQVRVIFDRTCFLKRK